MHEARMGSEGIKKMIFFVCRYEYNFIVKLNNTLLIMMNLHNKKKTF